MSLGKKILSNTFWQILGRLTTASIGIITVKLITNYLPINYFGQYTTLYEYISFFAIGADFGIYTIGVREMAKKEKTISEILSTILGIRVVLITIFLSLAILVAQLIPAYQNTLIQSGVWIIALSTSLTLLYGTLSSVLQYKLKMLYSTIALVIGKIVSASYVVYTIFSLYPNDLEKGFHHILLAGVFGNIVLLILIFLFVSRETQIKLKFDWIYTKYLIINALPLGLALILSTIYFRIDVILLGFLRNYHETGIYGVPLKIMEIVGVIPIFFMNSALPSITKAWKESKERFNQLLHRSWEFLLLIATPVLIGGIILAYPLTFIIASPQYLSGYHCSQDIQYVYSQEAEAIQKCSKIPTNELFAVESNSSVKYLQGSDLALKLLLLASFFTFLNAIVSFSLVAMDKQKILLIINFIGVIFNLSTNLIFIPKYGFMGAGMTTIFSEIIIFISGNYFLFKLIKFKIPLTKTFKILLSGLIMAVPVYYLQDISYAYLENANVLFLIPIGAITYFLSLYLLKAIQHDDLKRFLKFH